MDKRILAVLIAAMAGTAYAQTNSGGYVANSSGTAVTNSAGDCVRSNAGNGAVPCAPAAQSAAASGTTAAPREQVAQSSSARSTDLRGREPARFGPAATGGASATAGASAVPGPTGSPNDGYLVSSSSTAIVDSTHHCVHTGSWSPDKAAEPCDAVARASRPPIPVAEAPAPAPEPAPLAEAAPQTPPNVIEKVTLNTDVLFAFNKAELLPGGKDKLDQLAQDSQGAEVDRIVLAGYADRIGSDQYNKDLSERRAQAVADYLASKGVDQSRIQVEGRGEDNPITGNQCKRMGPEKASNKKLVSCLQPDRRVEAELLGSREVAGTASPATGAAGTTGTGTSGASGGGTSQ